ncbi:cation:proton antiporter subunit C [Gracilimonas tropica]|uniref:cation:proton antiporter subunit C n=1 Tax=Gracilimonas tropica TaxID=454600 RepID=UPI00035F2F87|nr:cation:proton antiporter subunit C [Gracilimonas tropica]
MLDFFMGHYAYWFTIILLAIGLYGMLIKKNLVKKIIGLSIFQAGVILFFVSVAMKNGATVPVKADNLPVSEVSNYLNALPHTLMLTAIVVGVATLGVAFALMINIYNRYGTLNEEELLDKIQ